MSRKRDLDMTSLLAPKGQGAAAEDSPSRPVIEAAQPSEPETRRIDETTNRRTSQRGKPKTVSGELVNLGFKVPREFRHRLRKTAAAQDIPMVEVLREAINLYDKKRGI